VTTDGERAFRVEFGDGGDEEAPRIDSSPAVGGGRAYIGCSNGYLYAVGKT
jgi:outer membrane protein assembly factor BamB